MRTDPTDTGGLFVGRRPGTAPVRYRGAAHARHGRAPGAGPRGRGRARWPMMLVCVTFWGPLPAGWLWVGSQVDYWTDSVSVGHPLDVRRAALQLPARPHGPAPPRPGLDPGAPRRGLRPAHRARSGRSSRSATVIGVTVFTFWFLIIHGPGSSLLARPRAVRRPARLLPPVPGAERGRGQRGPARALRAGARAGARARGAAGPERHHCRTSRTPRSSTASSWRAAGLNRYGDRAGGELRRALAQRHGVAEERIAVGHGAAELLGAAAQRAAGARRRAAHPLALLSALPAHGAARAAARAVPVEASTPSAICAAVTPRTRVVAMCNPNDPTGEHAPLDGAPRAAGALPERVVAAARPGARRLRRGRGRPTPPARTPPRAARLPHASRRPGAWRGCAAATRSARSGAAVLERDGPPLGVGALAQAGALAALRREAVVARRASRWWSGSGGGCSPS